MSNGVVGGAGERGKDSTTRNSPLLYINKSADAFDCLQAFSNDPLIRSGKEPSASPAVPVRHG